jgi:ribosome-associated protein
MENHNEFLKGFMVYWAYFMKARVLTAIMLINGKFFIDEKEITETFVRSSGPGGQNVNKVETAVQIRFDVGHSPSLPEEIRVRLMAMLRSRLTKEGILIITAQRYRTQDQNRQDARHRLMKLIERGTLPVKKRIPTKPTRSSQEARLAAKSHRSHIKQGRRGKGKAYE